MSAGFPRIVMCTCPRDPSFVEQTLTNLFEADPSATAAGPVRVLAQATSADFLGSWADDPRITVETMGLDELADCQRLSVPARTTFNGARTFVGSVPDGGLIYLEDDLEFADGWYTKAQETAQMLDAGSPGRKFAIALFCYYLYGPHRVTEYPYDSFVGSQALYFGPEALRYLKPWFFREKMRTKNSERPGIDMAIRDCLRYDNIQIWAAIPSLVQHVGYETVAASTDFMQSPTYRKQPGW
jgi:hypothetical protein